MMMESVRSSGAPDGSRRLRETTHEFFFVFSKLRAYHIKLAETQKRFTSREGA